MQGTRYLKRKQRLRFLAPPCESLQWSLYCRVWSVALSLLLSPLSSITGRQDRSYFWWSLLRENSWPFTSVERVPSSGMCRNVQTVNYSTVHVNTLCEQCTIMMLHKLLMRVWIKVWISEDALQYEKFVCPTAQYCSKVCCMFYC